MTKRSVFFINNNQLCRQDVMISWDLGFDREAKHAYIKRIRDCVPYLNVIDVTTASDDPVAQKLSPFFVTTADGLKVEDLYGKCHVQGAVEYYYLRSLTEAQYNYVCKQEAFMDVFHNPEKAFRTQAEALAVLQYIIANKLDVLDHGVRHFITWYKEFIKSTKVIGG